jgi:hypothetical protein
MRPETELGKSTIAVNRPTVWPLNVDLHGSPTALERRAETRFPRSEEYTGHVDLGTLGVSLDSYCKYNTVQVLWHFGISDHLKSIRRLLHW